MCVNRTNSIQSQVRQEMRKWLKKQHIQHAKRAPQHLLDIYLSGSCFRQEFFAFHRFFTSLAKFIGLPGAGKKTILQAFRMQLGGELEPKELGAIKKLLFENLFDSVLALLDAIDAHGLRLKEPNIVCFSSDVFAVFC